MLILDSIDSKENISGIKLKECFNPKVALRLSLSCLVISIIAAIGFGIPNLKTEISLTLKILFSLFYNLFWILFTIYLFRDAKYFDGKRRIKIFGILTFILATIPFFLDLFLGGFMGRWIVITVYSPLISFIYGTWISLAKEWKEIK